MSNQAKLNEYLSLSDHYNELTIFAMHLTVLRSYPSRYEGIDEMRDKMIEAIQAYEKTLINAITKMNDEILELMNK